MLRLLLVVIGLYFCLSLKAQELTLYIIPAPAEIDWQSPSSLMRTTLANQFKSSPGPVDYPLGHIYVGLRHPEKDEEILTGMTRDHKNSAIRKIFREGYGMGILFADIEGRLQSVEEVQKSIDALVVTGGMSFVSFKISEDAYYRLLEYYLHYKKFDLGSIYNGLNRPRECLGAGCAAFAISFLDLAGIDYTPWLEDWSLNVEVPDRLIGGLGVNNRHVSLLRLLLSNNWARNNEASFSFEVFEPYYMHQWVLNLHQKNNPFNEPGMERIKRDESPGILIDFSHKPTPQSPIFVCPEIELSDSYLAR